MIHLAVDHGKKFSHAVAMSDAGEILFDEKIETSPQGFALIKEALPPEQPVQSVVEAAWNWGKMFDMLEEIIVHGRKIPHIEALGRHIDDLDENAYRATHKGSFQNFWKSLWEDFLKKIRADI